MDTTPKQIRAFIAIELPPDIAAELEKLQISLHAAMPDRVLRWVRAGQIHLTLKFLGNVAAGDVADVAAAMCRACQGSTLFSLELQNLGCFPHSRNPRVVWVGIGGELEELHRLQSRIESAVEQWVERPENKPFRPHLTLARVSTQDRCAAARVGTMLETIDSKVHGHWRVPRVLLIKSELTPKGSIYTELAAAQL